MLIPKYTSEGLGKISSCFTNLHLIKVRKLKWFKKISSHLKAFTCLVYSGSSIKTTRRSYDTLQGQVASTIIIIDYYFICFMKKGEFCENLSFHAGKIMWLRRKIFPKIFQVTQGKLFLQPVDSTLFSYDSSSPD